MSLNHRPKESIKMRPCLCCDKVFRSTTYIRVCTYCKETVWKWAPRSIKGGTSEPNPES